MPRLPFDPAPGRVSG